jgi:hypothetical protein
VEKPRSSLERRRFVITIPRHLASDFGISPQQAPADLYAIHCIRRWLPRD